MLLKKRTSKKDSYTQLVSDYMSKSVGLWKYFKIAFPEGEAVTLFLRNGDVIDLYLANDTVESPGSINYFPSVEDLKQEFSSDFDYTEYWQDYEFAPIPEVYKIYILWKYNQ